MFEERKNIQLLSVQVGNIKVDSAGCSRGDLKNVFPAVPVDLPRTTILVQDISAIPGISAIAVAAKNCQVGSAVGAGTNIGPVAVLINTVAANLDGARIAIRIGIIAVRATRAGRSIDCPIAVVVTIDIAVSEQLDEVAGPRPSGESLRP